MDKQSFRKSAITHLRRCASQNVLQRDYAVNQQLSMLLDALSPKRILFYLPMPHESDLTKTMYAYQRKGKDIYIPHIVGESFDMVHLRLPFIKNSYGILESNFSFSHVSSLDVAIVPILGIDANAARIGFGKGMYDRFFSTRFQKMPLIIFVQRSLCMTHQVITQPHDIRGDFVITPEKTFYVQGLRYGNRTHHSRFRIRTCRWRRGVFRLPEDARCKL